jgi:uncharacterized protein (TIGR02145 family)
MAENLNVGTITSGGLEQTGFQIIKKYCYNNDDANSKIYGGLYTWSGMMQGAKPDSGIIGTTRGICPVGWHIPTLKEWNTLTSYLDEPVAGLKLKEAGSSHWMAGTIATNESGFTALPAGMWDGYYFTLGPSIPPYNQEAHFWTSSNDQSSGWHYAVQLGYNSERVRYIQFLNQEANSVRCIKYTSK